MKIFIKMIIVIFVISFISINKVFALDNNKVIIDEVDKIEKLASSYKESTGSSLSTSELVFQYLRRNRYNNSKWNLLLGNIDTNFVSYVNSNGNIIINDDSYLIDSSTGKHIDFIHMIVALSCYYKYGENINMGFLNISSDYAGWGGDLITYIDEINTYRTNNNITDQNILTEYSHKLIGTNKNSTFSSEDMFADLDAVNIYKSSDIDLSDISASLEKYYVSNSSAYNSTNRVSSFRNYIGNDKHTIMEKANSLLNNSMIVNLLDNGLTNRLKEIDYIAVTSSFADYILEESYLELLSSNGKMIVGDSDLKVNLYESNLGVSNISMTNDICDVKIDNDVMYIKAKKGGTTAITLNSFNNKVSATYNLNIKDEAPSIISDLEDEYTVNDREIFKFRLSAKGSNNLYTWYIGDSVEGEFTKIGESTIPEFELNSDKNLNSKYIKCVISNVGNNSVTSKVALLKVNETIENEISNVDTSDNIIKYIILFIGSFFVYALLVNKKMNKRL